MLLYFGFIIRQNRPPAHFRALRPNLAYNPPNILTKKNFFVNHSSSIYANKIIYNIIIYPQKRQKIELNVKLLIKNTPFGQQKSLEDSPPRQFFIV